MRAVARFGLAFSVLACFIVGMIGEVVFGWQPGESAPRRPEFNKPLPRRSSPKNTLPKKTSPKKSAPGILPKRETQKGARPRDPLSKEPAKKVGPGADTPEKAQGILDTDARKLKSLKRGSRLLKKPPFPRTPRKAFTTT